MSFQSNDSMLLLQQIKREFSGFQKYIGDRIGKMQEKNEEILHLSMLNLEKIVVEKVMDSLEASGEAIKKDIFGLQSYLERSIEKMINTTVKTMVEEAIKATNDQLMNELTKKFQSVDEIIQTYTILLGETTQTIEERLNSQQEALDKKIEENIKSQEKQTEIINQRNKEFYDEFNARHKEISDQVDIAHVRLQEIIEHNYKNNIETFTERVVLHLPPPEILYEHIHSAREILKDDVRSSFVITYVHIIKKKFLEAGASTSTVSSVIASIETVLGKESEDEFLKDSIKEEIVEMLNRLEVISRTEKK
ncbi:MAG: hypothetical protein HeimC3_08950 [Candidatus Heimdallarchaeota archaeon LC_3]|nr:MAG: hypothetical protein HeimC3_08950 [Candidatus Heimdallarchaeota archaeon LC_3]